MDGERTRGGALSCSGLLGPASALAFPVLNPPVQDDGGVSLNRAGGRERRFAECAAGDWLYQPAQMPRRVAPPGTVESRRIADNLIRTPSREPRPCGFPTR